MSQPDTAIWFLFSSSILVYAYPKLYSSVKKRLWQLHCYSTVFGRGMSAAPSSTEPRPHSLATWTMYKGKHSSACAPTYMESHYPATGLRNRCQETWILPDSANDVLCDLGQIINISVPLCSNLQYGDNDTSL